MKIVSILSIPVLWCVCLFLFGCTMSLHGVSEQEHLYHLSWIDDHTVLVSRTDSDANWIYSFKNGSAVSLPDRISNDLPTPSPSGEYLLATYWKFGYLSIVKTEQASDSSAVQHFSIPEMPIMDDDVEKVHLKEAFWISNREIYLEQYNMMSGRFQCHIFNLDRQRWEKAPHCLNVLEFGPVTSGVDNMGDDLYAIYTSAEGQVSARIVKWTPKSGIKQKDYPDIWIGMGEPFEFYTEDEGASIYALSAVPLRGHKSLIDLKIDYSLNDRVLYEWTQDKGFQKTGVQLAPHIALRSVKSKLTAWVESDGTEICLGNLERKVRCQDISVAKPRP